MKQGGLQGEMFLVTIAQVFHVKSIKPLGELAELSPERVS